MNGARGWLDGFIGVLIFSASLPATKIAVSGFAPLFLTNARAAIAGVLAAGALLLLGERRPDRADLWALAATGLGVVIGFPLLTAFALQHITSAQSVVFIGLLPLSTAVFAVLRGGERPRPAFWAFALVGAALVVGFALAGLGAGVGLGSAGTEPATLGSVGSGVEHAADGLARMAGSGAGSGASSAGPTTPVGVGLRPGADPLVGAALMLGAILACGFGYAEGARLSRRLGGWQVICWALVIALPLVLPLALGLMPTGLGAVPPSAWAGLGYVSIFSMLIGFVFWYRGLAAGGAAAVGQLQLLQPFFGLVLSAVLLGDAVTPAMLVVTLGIVACVAGAKRFAAR
jgi:drug/metabolite transporter (DMT)-like permease